MVKIEWAYDELNNLVHISKNTDKYGKYYFFQNKEVELVKKQGDILKWHYAVKSLETYHNSKSYVEGQGESFVHMLVKQLLVENLQWFISKKEQLVLVKPVSNFWSKELVYDVLGNIDTVRMEVGYKGFRPDISLYRGDELVKVIEVVYSHEIEDESFTLYREDKIDVIEVVVSKFDVEMCLELIDDARRNRVNFKNWIVRNSNISVYVNSFIYSQGDIDSLVIESQQVTVDLRELRFDYCVYLATLQELIKNIELAYYCLERLEELSTDIEEVLISIEGLKVDYEEFLSEVKSKVVVARKEFLQNTDTFVKRVKGDIFRLEAEFNQLFCELNEEISLYENNVLCKITTAEEIARKRSIRFSRIDSYKNKDNYLFLDIETDNSNGYGTDPFRAKIVTVQAMMIDRETKILVNEEVYKTNLAFLEKRLVVGHNLLFESKFLKYHLNLNLYTVYDTMLAEHVITGGAAGRKSLAELVDKYCGVRLDKTLQCSFRYGEELTVDQLRYAFQDILYLPEIMEKQIQEIERLNLWEIIDIEMRCIPAVAWMELSGANVDIPTLKNIEAKVREQKDNSEKMLISALTYEENKGKIKQRTLFGGNLMVVPKLNSPQDLLRALHQKGFSKLNGTDKKELSKYQGNPIITELKAFRESEKLISGFINRMLGYDRKTKLYGKSEFINPKTNRVHASFNQCGARSGRFSCSEPNMQQQPSRVEEWRHIYKAMPGNKIIAVDYSQIELRIVGQLSKEPAYIEAYTEGYDLHQRTASQMFAVPLEEVHKDQRKMAKSINFGLNYGMGAGTLKERIKIDVNKDISEEEAQRLRDIFQKMYPRVTAYLQRSGEKGVIEGKVHTLAGRLCNTRDFGVEIEEFTARNRGKNLPIQGLCADMLKTAMGNLFLILEPRGVKLINSVHDELVFECKAEEAEEVGNIIKEEMEAVGRKYLKDLPCIAEVTIDDYWRH